MLFDGEIIMMDARATAIERSWFAKRVGVIRALAAWVSTDEMVPTASLIIFDGDDDEDCFSGYLFWWYDLNEGIIIKQNKITVTTATAVAVISSTTNTEAATIINKYVIYLKKTDFDYHHLIHYSQNYYYYCYYLH